MQENHAEIIESALIYIENFDKPIRKLIAQLRIGNVSGLSNVANAIEGTQWLLKVCTNLKQDGLVQFESNEEMVQSLSDSIAEIETAFVQNDITLLADILEYEISVMVTKMLEVIKEAR